MHCRLVWKDYQTAYELYTFIYAFVEKPTGFTGDVELSKVNNFHSELIQFIYSIFIYLCGRCWIVRSKLISYWLH